MEACIIFFIGHDEKYRLENPGHESSEQLSPSPNTRTEARRLRCAHSLDLYLELRIITGVQGSLPGTGSCRVFAHVKRTKCRTDSTSFFFFLLDISPSTLSTTCLSCRTPLTSRIIGECYNKHRSAGQVAFVMPDPATYVVLEFMECENDGLVVRLCVEDYRMKSKCFSWKRKEMLAKATHPSHLASSSCNT